MTNVIELLTDRGVGERALFIGNTGSGKTVLLQSFLAHVGSAVVLDSKGDPSWETFARSFGYVISGDPAAIRRHAKVIFRVDTRSLLDRAGWRRPGSPGHVWTTALSSLWWRTEEGGGPTVVVFDEGFDTMPSSGGAHPDAQRIFTSGRTQGLPAWLGAQLPIYVDKRALSQAEHCFSFAQPMPEYRELIRERRGVDSAVLGTLDFKAHEFAHHRIGEQTWSEFGAVSPVSAAPAGAPADLAPLPVPESVERVDSVEATPNAAEQLTTPASLERAQ